jgi:hypothetical protein
MRLGRPYTVLVLVSFCVLSCGLTRLFVFGVRDSLADVARLENAIPAIQSLEVMSLRAEPRCKRLDYARGAYSSTLGGGSTCDRFLGPPKVFDAQALEDFDKVWRVVSNSGVPIDWIDVNYIETGQLQTAEFHISCLWCRRRYIYSPDYGELPPPPSADTVYERINDNWYLIDEDWN